jgi:hypothetical protein
VLFHYGTPGVRLLAPQAVRAAVRRGVRLLVLDRPGYGGSSRHGDRRVADVVADIARLADALGWDRFATWGVLLEPGHRERTRMAYLGGVDGWIDDIIALTRIEVPVSLWYGPDDVLSPAAMLNGSSRTFPAPSAGSCRPAGTC